MRAKSCICAFTLLQLVTLSCTLKPFLKSKSYMSIAVAPWTLLVVVSLELHAVLGFMTRCRDLVKTTLLNKTSLTSHGSQTLRTWENFLSRFWRTMDCLPHGIRWLLLGSFCLLKCLLNKNLKGDRPHSLRTDTAKGPLWYNRMSRSWKWNYLI